MFQPWRLVGICAAVGVLLFGQIRTAAGEKDERCFSYAGGEVYPG